MLLERRKLSLLLVDQGKMKLNATGPMTTHKHHIVYKSQGGTDDPSNLVELDFITHAELHAKDFLEGGPEFDFRHEGYKYFDEDLRKKLRAEKGRRKRGNGGNFGEGPPTALGKRVWTNEDKEVRSEECPGAGWTLGRSFEAGQHLPHDGSTTREKRWWNNGEIAVRVDETPGPGWVEGQLPSTNEKKGRPGVPKSDEWKKKMKQMRVGDLNPCAGRRWVTNGETNLYLKPGEETPENYKPGRTL